MVAFPVTEISNAPDDTKAGNVPFSNLVDVLHHFFDNLYVVVGDEERVLFKKDVDLYVSEVQHKGGAMDK